MIDLRSDTVTKPTDEMREAMKGATVGDDVLGEDPTVKELEELAAKKMGKESGLFVTSGTQGNITSLLTHTQPGEEIIFGRDCHIYRYEVGGYASLAGLSGRTLDDSEGYLDLSEIEEAVREENIHHPETSLLCIENTHNVAGGVPVDFDYTNKVSDIAHKKGLNVHLDGARVFNASVALDEDIAKLVEPVDSVMFCLSKGLSAPVGSMLVGSEEFIERARKNRKRLGGGMRQVGVIAAPGIISLKEMVHRLKKDHDNARRLAEGLKDMGVDIDPNKYKTNIVMLDTSQFEMKAEGLRVKLEEKNIRTLALGKDLMRFVTHREVSREDIDKVLNIFEEEIL
ncbi:MAG: low-specificity L-threonine aldolase [Candidatus Thermoplasmatota archaeon]|nr:low-specificity L-threonine aldolase [Candidatus Thermoplasmatota archaeon]MBS3790123.1 low-specificity L-threonine aldolase [Candidatus Thermoplasmatota archaeon]